MACIQIYNGIVFKSNEELKQYILENYKSLSEQLKEYPEFAKATVKHLYNLDVLDPSFYENRQVLEKFNSYLNSTTTPGDVNDYINWLQNSDVYDSIINTTAQNDYLDVENLDTDTASAFSKILKIVGDNFTFEDAANITNNLIKDGQYLSGYFFNNVIALNSKGFKKGTEYHESFHAVYRSLLNTKERENLLSLAKKEFKKPSSKDLKNLKAKSSYYNNLSNNELEELYYEEKIADEFAEYAYKGKDTKSWLGDLFDKLIDLINKIFGNRALLEKEFDKILQGQYAQRTPKSNSYTTPAFSSLYKPSNQLLDSKTSNIIFSRIETVLRKNSDVIDVKNLNISDIDTAKRIANAIYFSPEKFEDFLGEELSDDVIEKIENIRDILNNPINTPILLQEMKKRLDRNSELDTEDDTIEQEVGSKAMLFAGSSITKGGYMNSPKQIRTFLEGLVKYEDFLELGLSKNEIEGDDLFGVRISANRVFDSLLRRVSGLSKNQILSAIVDASTTDSDIKVFADALLNKVMEEYYEGSNTVLANGEEWKDLYNPKIHTYKVLGNSSSTFQGFVSAMHVVNTQPIDTLIQPSKKGQKEIIRPLRADTDNIESQIINTWKALSAGIPFKINDTANIVGKIEDIFKNYAVGTTGAIVNKNFTQPSAAGYFKTDVTQLQDLFKSLGLDIPLQLIEYSLLQTYLSHGQYNEYDPISSIIGDIDGDIILEKDKTRLSYESVPPQTRPIRLDDLTQIKQLLTGKSTSLFEYVKDETDENFQDEAIPDVELDFQYRIKNWAKSSSVFDTNYFNTSYKKADGKKAYSIVKSNYLFDINNFYAALHKSSFLKYLKEGDIDSAKNIFFNLLDEYEIIPSSNIWGKNELFQSVINSPRFKNGTFSDYAQDMGLYLSNTLKITKFDKDETSSNTKAEKGLDYGDLTGTDKVLQEAYMFADEVSKGTSKGRKITPLKSLGENAEKSTNYLSKFEYYAYVNSSGQYSPRLFQDLNHVVSSEIKQIERLNNQRKSFVQNFVVGEKVKVNPESNMFYGVNNVHYVTDFSKVDSDGVSYYYYPTNSTTITKVAIDHLNDTVLSVEEINRSENIKLLNKYRGELPITIQSLLEHLNLPEYEQALKEGISQILDGERSTDDSFFSNDDWSKILDAKTAFDINQFVKSNVLYTRVNGDVVNTINNLFPSYFNSSTEDFKGEGLLKEKTNKFVLDEGKYKNFMVNYILSNFNTDAMHDMSAGLQVANAVDKFKRNPSQIADGNGMGSGTTNISVVESKGELYDEVSMGRTGLKIDLKKAIDVTDAEVFVTSEWLYKTFLHSLGRKSPQVKQIWKKMFAGQTINQKEFNSLSDAGATMLKLKLVSRQVDGYYKMGNAVLDPAEFAVVKGFTQEEINNNQLILNELADIYVDMLDKHNNYSNNEGLKLNLENYPNFANSLLAKEVVSLNDVRLMMHSLRVPKLGTEVLFNTFDSMLKGKSDWLVFNSATKTIQKDLTPINKDGKASLKAFEINNSLIRQQVEMMGAVQSKTVTDPTQKMEIIKSEQLVEAISYFAGKPISSSYAASAYSKQLQQRVLLGMKEVQNALLHDDGEINMVNLVKTFRDTVSATNPDPFMEQFFQSLDGQHFDLNPNNYGPTFYKAASMFLAYISKNTTTHKTPGAKFTLRTDWGTKIAKLYKYNRGSFNKEEVQQLENLYNNISKDGKSVGKLNDQQQNIVDKMFKVYGGKTFEESFTNMISQEKETIYLTEDEYYSSEPDEYGRPFNDKSRLTNLEDKYFYDSGVDDLVLERLQHRVKDADGNFYSEVVVSEWVANIFGLKIGDEIPSQLLKFFGVRIPTQDKHSMSSYKIVKTLPAQFGNVLITPYEMIHLAGQDLDIDAVYAKMFSNDYSAGDNITYGSYLISSTPVEDAFKEQLVYTYYNNKRYKETVNSLKSANATLREININPSLSNINKQIIRLKAENNNVLNEYTLAFNSLPFEVKRLFYKNRAGNKVNNESVAEELFSDYNYLQEVDEQSIVNSLVSNYKKDAVVKLKDIISGKVKGDVNFANVKLARINEEIRNKELEVLTTLDYLKDVSNNLVALLTPTNQDINDFSRNITNMIRVKSEIINEIEQQELYSFLNLPSESKPSGKIGIDDIYEVFKNEYSSKIKNNVKAFENRQILDLEPLNRNEAANIQLQLEIALQHNTGTKEIAGTPATTDIIENAYDSIIKPSELKSASVKHTGFHSPADKAIHANNIAEGADGIGIAASFHATIQQAATNGLSLTNDYVLFGNRNFVFNDLNGNRVNDSNSSVISMFVDNPKLALAYLVRMNITTAPIGMTLLSVGIPFEQVVGILNQPSIQRISQIVTQNSGVLKLKDGKTYAWSEQMANIILQTIQDEGITGVLLPHSPSIKMDITNDDLLNPNNLVAFTLLYNAALENRKHWGNKQEMYTKIKETLEREGKLDIFKNVVIDNKSEFNFDTLDNFENLLGAYDKFQHKVLDNILRAAKVNSKMISLTNLNGIKKGVSGSFDNVESIENSLKELGYKYSVDNKNTNKKGKISEIINLYQASSAETPFSNIDVMLSDKTNPLLVENIKSVIYSDRAIASQIFLTRTPFGKRVLSTLYNTVSPYAANLEDSRRKIESSLLAGMLMLRVRKKLGNMKASDQEIKNIFLDAIKMEETPLRDGYVFNYEQLFTNNTQVMKDVLSYFYENKSRYKFMSKIKVKPITFTKLGNQTLHKFETGTFTELAPEEVSQLQDEFRVLMDDPNARPFIEAIVRQSFLLQSGRFKAGSLIRTLDAGIVKDVISSLDDALNVLSFKPGSNTQFTANDFINQFGVSMHEMIQGVQLAMLSNPDFNFEVRTINKNTLNIQKNYLEKKSQDEKEYEIISKESLTTDAYDNTEESNVEDAEKEYTSVFNVPAPIYIKDDKVIINLFGGYNGENFGSIINTLKHTNVVAVESEVIKAPTAENPNNTKKVVKLLFPNIIKTKLDNKTVLYKLRTVKTNKEGTYKDEKGNKLSKRVVVSAEIATSIYDVPKWYRTKMGKNSNENIINMWNDRLLKEFTTYGQDGAIMFAGTAAVYEPYHENGNSEISNFGFTVGQMDTMFIPEVQTVDKVTTNTGRFVPKSKSVETKVKKIISAMIKESSFNEDVNQLYSEIVDPEKRIDAFKNYSANEYFNEIIKRLKC